MAGNGQLLEGEVEVGFRRAIASTGGWAYYLPPDRVPTRAYAETARRRTGQARARPPQERMGKPLVSRSAWWAYYLSPRQGAHKNVCGNSMVSRTGGWARPH